MRTNKKQVLIAAAVKIVEEHGLEALTYESLAQASGLSKSGLIYHLPSRDALLSDMVCAMIAQWEADLIEAAGAPAEQLTQRERFIASLTVFSKNATRADLILTLALLDAPHIQRMWNGLLSQWTPSQDSIDSDPLSYLGVVIADGLWVHDHVNVPALSDARRHALVRAALELLSGAPLP